MIDKSVLEKLSAVNLAVSVWSGSKALDETDLRLTVMPPKDLVKLGTKKIINPKDISVFDNIRSGIRKRLHANGFEFMNSIVVPTSRAATLSEYIANEKVKFNQSLAILLEKYDELVANWIKRNDKFKHMLVGKTLPKEELLNRYHFNWSLYHLASPDNDRVTQNHFINELNRIPEMFLQSLSKRAVNARHRILIDTGLSPKTSFLKEIEHLAFFLGGFSFIDQRHEVVSDFLWACTKIFRSEAHKSVLKNEHVKLLRIILTALITRDEYEEFADHLREVDDTNESLHFLMNHVKN